MNCRSCGTEMSEGASACPSCGAQQLAPTLEEVGAPGSSPPERLATPGVPAPGAPSIASGATAFSFSAGRWSRAERITGVATLVLFIALFLPWFGVDFGFGSVTVDGLWHGWMYLVLILSLAELGYLAVRAGFATRPFKLGISDPQLWLAATGLNLLLTLLAFVLKPGGSAVGWRFGAFVALVAAAVAAAPWAMPLLQARKGRAR